MQCGHAADGEVENEVALCGEVDESVSTGSSTAEESLENGRSLVNLGERRAH